MVAVDWVLLVSTHNTENMKFASNLILIKQTSSIWHRLHLHSLKMTGNYNLSIYNSHYNIDTLYII